MFYGLVRRSARQVGRSKADLLLSYGLVWRIARQVGQNKAELLVSNADWLGGVPDKLAGIRQSSWCLILTG